MSNTKAMKKITHNDVKELITAIGWLLGVLICFGIVVVGIGNIIQQLTHGK